MEAAFLASIIPNPTRYHYMYDRGAMSEAWRRRVDDVLFKMAEQGVLGSEDLARALAEPDERCCSRRCVASSATDLSSDGGASLQARAVQWKRRMLLPSLDDIVSVPQAHLLRHPLPAVLKILHHHRRHRAA